MPINDPSISCSKCKLEASLEEAEKYFFKRQSKRGFQSECKKCRKLYRTKYIENNNDEIKIKNKIYKEKNKNYIRIKSKEYREINKEYLKTKAKVYDEKNKEKIKFKRIKRIYGLSDDKWLEIYTHQNGKCPICYDDLSNTKTICIDHCHNTKKIRGLLCFNCNILLGHYEKAQCLSHNISNYLLKKIDYGYIPKKYE